MKINKNSLPVKQKEQGSWFKWFVCSLQCSNYTKPFKYDWFKDKCECRGNWIYPMWKR